jgi:hypothetical protein
LLLAMRARKPAVLRAGARLWHRAFFTCAAGIVYLTHRPVLRGAGYGIGSFLRVCATQYAFYMDAPVTICRESQRRLSPRP